ncbi:MAG: hypothetical protein AB8F78_08705 [Saprospiraceae bacterium]
MNSPTFFLLGFLLCFSQFTLAQTEVPTVLISDTIPFELTEHNNISIQAVVNGSDTVNLMFHTAANDVSLITSSAEKTTSIVWDKSSDIQSWGGESPSRVSTNNSLQIGKSKWDSLNIWEGQNSGPTTDGKFGPNLFENHAIELDFDKRILIVHPTLPTKVDGFEKVALQNQDGLMFIEGTSKIGEKDYPQKFLIHSGFSGLILYDDEFAKTSRIGSQIEITSEQELKDSYNNVLKTKKGTLPEFSIGATTFDSITVGFFEGSIGRQKMSVMGGGMLKRFHVVIDASRENIYLKAS